MLQTTVGSYEIAYVYFCQNTKKQFDAAGKSLKQYERIVI